MNHEDAMYLQNELNAEKASHLETRAAWDVSTLEAILAVAALNQEVVEHGKTLSALTEAASDRDVFDKERMRCAEGWDNEAAAHKQTKAALYQAQRLYAEFSDRNAQAQLEVAAARAEAERLTRVLAEVNEHALAVMLERNAERTAHAETKAALEAASFRIADVTAETHRLGSALESERAEHGRTTECLRISAEAYASERAESARLREELERNRGKYEINRLGWGAERQRRESVERAWALNLLASEYGVQEVHPGEYWHRSGPVPESVAALVREHAKHPVDECDLCSQRAPLKTEVRTTREPTGASDMDRCICAWGCSGVKP